MTATAATVQQVVEYVAKADAALESGNSVVANLHLVTAVGHATGLAGAGTFSAAARRESLAVSLESTARRVRVTSSARV